MSRYEIQFQVHLITPSDKHIPATFNFQIYLKDGEDLMDIANKLLKQKINKELPKWKYEITDYLIMAY